MAAFTPGPWQSEGDEVVAADGYTVIADLCVFSSSAADEWRHNVNLIAAAPDLYQALKLWDRGCLRDGGPYPNCECYGCVTRAALAKADGVLTT